MDLSNLCSLTISWKSERMVRSFSLTCRSFLSSSPAQEARSLDVHVASVDKSCVLIKVIL